MQQKLQFIVTILHRPSLLIFDEPFSGFDPINVDLLKNEIITLKEEGSTIIFSTHNMESVEELCDHITLIDDGVKLVEGEINNIRNEYKSNIFQVGFQGDVSKVRTLSNNHFEILSTTKSNDHAIARIKITDNSPANELLAALIPIVTILSFNEELPGMRDIFIRIVTEGKKKKV